MDQPELVIARLVRLRLFWDVLFVVLVAIAGSTIGSRYINAFQETASLEFIQQEFGAAVALACGHGFVNPAPAPTLNAFLARTRDEMSCADLRPASADEPPTYMQRFYRYLMTAVALEWKWSGVSWSRLTPLFGLMFGLTLCAAYGLFRLAGGPLIALVATAPLAISAHHLGQLPFLRDYAKGPFILLLMLVMARLAMPPFSRRRALMLSCAFGLVLGVGLGFRPDLLINVPPFLAVVFLLFPCKLREEIPLKAACAGVAMLVFLVSAWPIVRAYGAGRSNTGHVAVLGLASGFDEPLGLTRPAYDVVSQYLDGYAEAAISAHSVAHTARAVQIADGTYDAAAAGLLADVVKHWPADVFVRGLAASLQVLDFPFSVGRVSPAIPAGVRGAGMGALYKAQISVLRVLSGLGPLLILASVLIVGMTSARAGIGLGFLLLYYAGFSGVQFQVRHFFHLEFIAWWAGAFVVAATAGAFRQLAAANSIPRVRMTQVRGGLITVMTMIVVVLCPLWSLRWYQQRHVPDLLDTYVAAHRTSLALSRTTRRDGTLIAMADLWADRTPTERFSVRYLAVESGAEGCAASGLPMTFAYDSQTSAADFSTLVRVPVVDSGHTFRFTPVFYNGTLSRFAGIVVPAGSESCIKSVSVVDDLRPLPVLAAFTRAPGDRAHAWYQRVARVERDPTDEPLVYSQPAGLIAVSDAHVHGGSLLAPDRVAPGVRSRPEGHGWIGTVTPYAPDAQLLHFPAQQVENASVLRVTGVLRRGGLLVGVLENDRWLHSEGVDVPGPFTVLIRARTAGTYGALISDFSKREWRMESSSVLRTGAQLVAPWLLVDDFELHDVRWVPPGA